MLLLNVFFCCVFISAVDSLKRYYASESCGHVYGPDQLTVLEFDKDVSYEKNKPSTEQNLKPPMQLRNTIWECIIVVRGMPSVTTNRSIGLQWRDFHIWDPDINTVADSVDECGKAYVTIYRGTDTSAKRSWTLCGKDTNRIFFEWVGDYITFKFYADFRRNASYTEPPTSPTTPQAPCVDAQNVTENGTTALPICPSTEIVVPVDNYPYPEVYFRADVTSFDYACTESLTDETLKCNQSKRCLDVSLMCDYFFSHNCKTMGFPQDKTDQTKDAPSYCFRKTTTTPVPSTTPEPPPPPFPWEAISGVVGAILAIMLLSWCCWRPGYLPWRLSRLRNVPIFNTQKCVCCRRGPTVCCPCLKCCDGSGGSEEDSFGFTAVGGGARPAGSKVPYSRLDNKRRPGDKYRTANGYTVSQKHPADFYGKDPNNWATDWLKLVSGDGAHLREQR